MTASHSDLVTSAPWSPPLRVSPGAADLRVWPRGEAGRGHGQLCGQAGAGGHHSPPGREADGEVMRPDYLQGGNSQYSSARNIFRWRLHKNFKR